MLDKCLVFMQESCVRSKFLSFSLRPAVFCRDVMCPFFTRAACKMFIICLFTVILSSLPNTPPVDEGTIFWTKDGTSIAQVDTFLYCVCIIIMLCFVRDYELMILTSESCSFDEWYVYSIRMYGSIHHLCPGCTTCWCLKQWDTEMPGSELGNNSDRMHGCTRACI